MIEFKKMTEVLKTREDKHRALIENLGEGIGILDLSYNFTFSNPALEEIFNTNKLIGRSLKEFSQQNEFNIFVEESKITYHKKRQFDLHIITDNEQNKILNVTLTPQLDKLGKKIIGTCCIFKDITQIKALIKQKEEARKAAEQAFRIIEEKNNALIELNDKLQKSEAKLSELNKVLMEYIKATGK